MKAQFKFSNEEALMMGIVEFHIACIPKFIELNSNPVCWDDLFSLVQRYPYQGKEVYLWYCKCMDIRDNLWRGLYK